MAKKSKSVAFKNATISMKDMTITEYVKDETKAYSLKKVLEEWDGIDNISLTLKIEDEIPSIPDA